MSIHRGMISLPIPLDIANNPWHTVPMTTKTFTPPSGPVRDAWLSRHTGYVVENEFGAVVATVTESRLRNQGGYIVRLYTSPDDYEILRVGSILDARDIAEQHAGLFA